MFHGFDYSNETFPYCFEYFLRLGMKKIGYGESFDDLDWITCESYMIIAREISDQEKAQSNKSSKGHVKK